MKKLSKLSILILFLSLFIGTNVSAATTPVGSSQDNGVKLVATINIQNAKLVSQTGNKFDISFDITNGSIVQSGIKYGVELVKVTKQSQFLVDEKIYDEVFSLSANTQAHKDIVYEAPNYLSGDYTLLLISKTENGLPLSLNPFKTVTLTATAKGVIISPETCFLTVQGEKSNTKYTLSQGVDVLPSESLNMNCDVTNTSDATVSVVPSFVTYYRTNFGKTVETPNIDTKAIVFNKGENKSISIQIPKATVPQAYDVAFNLTNKDITSNTISAHYVIHGASASIQSATLDKDYYNKGDTANVSLFLAGSADNFNGSRIKSEVATDYNISVLITDGSGKQCADEYKNTVSLKDALKAIPVVVTKSCSDPVIQVTLSDKNGNILDQKNFKFKTTSIPQSSKSNNTLYLVVILLVIILVIYILRKKKNDEMMNGDSSTPEGGSNLPLGMILFFIISFACITPAGVAKADTFNVVNSVDGKTVDLIVTTGLNNTNYHRGDVITASGNVYINNCLNSYEHRLSDLITVSFNANNGASPFTNANLISNTGQVNTYNAGSYLYGSANLTAPTATSGGYYFAQFTASVSGPTSSSSGSHNMLYYVYPQPTVNVVATKTIIGITDSTTISWTPLNATSCSCVRQSNSTSCGSGGSGYTVGNTYSGSQLSPKETFVVTCVNN